jgi:hypothetical protein
MNDCKPSAYYFEYAKGKMCEIVFLIKNLLDLCKKTCGVIRGFKEGFESCYQPRDYKNRPCDYQENTSNDCDESKIDCSKEETKGI